MDFNCLKFLLVQGGAFPWEFPACKLCQTFGPISCLGWLLIGLRGTRIRTGQSQILSSFPYSRPDMPRTVLGILAPAKDLWKQISSREIKERDWPDVLREEVKWLQGASSHVTGHTRHPGCAGRADVFDSTQGEGLPLSLVFLPPCFRLSRSNWFIPLLHRMGLNCWKGDLTLDNFTAKNVETLNQIKEYLCRISHMRWLLAQANMVLLKMDWMMWEIPSKLKVLNEYCLKEKHQRSGPWAPQHSAGAIEVPHPAAGKEKLSISKNFPFPLLQGDLPWPSTFFGHSFQLSRECKLKWMLASV